MNPLEAQSPLRNSRGFHGHSLVTATCRLAFPSSMTSRTSSGLDTNLSVQPWGQAGGNQGCSARGAFSTNEQNN